MRRLNDKIPSEEKAAQRGVWTFTTTVDEDLPPSEGPVSNMSEAHLQTWEQAREAGCGG